MFCRRIVKGSGIMSDREYIFQNVCRTVKIHLKCPATAIFSINDFSYSETSGYFSGYVDSQNSFGAMIRSEFGENVKKENENEFPKIISLYIKDGNGRSWLIGCEDNWLFGCSSDNSDRRIAEMKFLSEINYDKVINIMIVIGVVVGICFALLLNSM